MDLSKCLNTNDFFYKNRCLKSGYVPDYWSKETFTDQDTYQIDELEMCKWIVENLTGLWAVRYKISSIPRDWYGKHHILIAFEDPQDHLMFSIMGSFQQFKVM